MQWSAFRFLMVMSHPLTIHFSCTHMKQTIVHWKGQLGSMPGVMITKDSFGDSFVWNCLQSPNFFLSCTSNLLPEKPNLLCLITRQPPERKASQTGSLCLRHKYRCLCECLLCVNWHAQGNVKALSVSFSDSLEIETKLRSFFCSLCLTTSNTQRVLAEILPSSFRHFVTHLESAMLSSFSSRPSEMHTCVICCLHFK